MSTGRPRFIVTELVGYRRMTNGGGSYADPGRSFQVVDRACNYRLMAIFDSESSNNGSTRFWRLTRAREKAETMAAELNEAHG